MGVARTRYKYRVFGLNLISDIQFPDFPKGNWKADVDISLGEVADKIVNIENSGNMFFKNTKNKYWLYIKGIGHFYIENGKKVVIEPEKNVSSDTFMAFCISYIFRALFFQKKLLALHGSAVVINDKCYVFCGNSGSGKSTICNYFINNGYKFLSDETSLIKKEYNTFHVQPSYNGQRICYDSVDKLCIHSDAIMGKWFDKYLISIPQSFCNESIPIAAIVELSPCLACKTTIKEIKGMQKVNNIYKNLYYQTFIHLVGMDKSFFTSFLSFAKTVPLYKMERPIGEYTLQEQLGLILDLDNKLSKV